MGRNEMTGFLKDFCDSFSGTYLADSLERIFEIYDEAEAKSFEFTSEYDVHCPPGCGACCEHFLPDITRAEALAVAAYLLFEKNDPSLIEKLEASSDLTEPPCPLYNPDSPFHCQVYPARPLICRLFGACASSDKDGNAVFRKCRYNTTDSMPASLRITDARPAEMEDFAIRINAISPDKPEMLPRAVMDALCKLRFLSSVDVYMGGDDDDTPTPTPLAS